MKNEISKFLRGFSVAWHGVAHTIKHERNFRVHIIMTAYVIFFAIIGKTTPAQAAVLSVCCALVLAAELINTAIELLCNKITTLFDATIGLIKDLSAGAVLISAIFTAIAGLFIFLSPAVFFTVFDLFFTYPAVFLIFLISIPISLAFIFRYKK